MFNFSKAAIRCLVISLCIMYASCEKVIDVDLRNTESKYVIEGIISDKHGESRVLLSRTRKFSESSDFAGVTGARIMVSDNLGNQIVLSETMPGVYSSSSLLGLPNTTYYLNVAVNGQTFTAASAMSVKVNVDTVFASEEFLVHEKVKLTNYAYQDPVGKGNCFHFVQYINGIRNRSVFIRNDDYHDGRYVQAKLWYFDEEEDEDRLKQGDTVDVDIFCISPDIYKYWFSLDRSATGEGESVSPANPVSNIKGGALGYFSAQTYQRKSFIVQ